MTNPSPPPPPTDLDELASAIVDRLLAPGDADRARQDPVVAQRVDEILAVRAALRATPPSPPGAADAAVNAALGAFDFARPPARSRGPVPWLAAAAAVLVVGLVAAGLVRGGSNDQDTDTAAEAPSAGDVSQDAPMSAADEGAGAFEEESQAGADDRDGQLGSVTPPDLGSVVDLDDLISKVEGSVAAGQTAPQVATTPPEQPPDPLRCTGLSIPGDPERGTATFVADAEYQGNPVRIHVYELDGAKRLVATDHSCVDVVDVPFTS